MADTLALGASAARLEGSNPSPPTKQKINLVFTKREQSACALCVRGLKGFSMFCDQREQNGKITWRRGRQTPPRPQNRILQIFEKGKNFIFVCCKNSNEFMFLFE